ncbi:zinc-dependent metalloprotease [Piscinibacter sp. SJAQ100]|uniref:Zinc-dependent metalloprotease n=2 Tax=Aquariibacter albus TaxID=2759899 RepID=A0A839HG70_9BURK|nr:zinc-dependent metalloprotease [Aquariibacter albus]
MLAGLMLAGCAVPPIAPAAVGGTAAPAAAAGPASAPAATSPTAARPATAPPEAPAAGSPPAFAVVSRGAETLPGLLPVWRKDERHWIELRPEDFERPYFLSPKIATGIGSAGIYGGLMASSFGQAVGRPQIVQFRKVGNLVQLLALNSAYVAPGEGVAARAVLEAGYSPSLIASAALASAPHPERKSVLIDLGLLFQGDLAGLGAALQRSYRQPYGHDTRNSALIRLRNSEGLLAFEVRNHYVAALAAAGGAPGAPAPTLPPTLADVRSLFVTMHYSLSPLPAEPLLPRRADARIGHFVTTVHDVADELPRSPKRRYVNRWRLEKQDPQAALSPPKKPITFWLDRSVPLRYRDSLRAGILEWNKAFAAIGFQDAIRVEQQPDDAAFDTLDSDKASVRWMSNAEASFGAIGPSHVDPRSGEILDADIAFESLSSRALRTLRSQLLGPMATADSATDPAGHDPALCRHGDHAAEQLGYALDLLASRGDLDPDSPEAEAFVQAYLKDVAMHEVGHALGLRHNFRASTVYTEAQLADPAFTAVHGQTGSVMEYAPVHLAPAGQPQPEPFQSTLGPYDYWAIEYAYKPIAAAQEEAELQRIAARSAEPLLAYATDEDNAVGLDPEAQPFDLGADPIVHARKRFALARELIQRQGQRALRSDQDYSVLRRSVAYALRDMGRVATVLLRQIGGVRTLRDHPGSGREPLQPLPASTQREALGLLGRELLAADALQLSPALLRRMAPDFAERQDAMRLGGPAATDYPLSAALLELQRGVLAPIYSDALASRLLDAQEKLDPGQERLGLAEVYQRIGRAVWSDLDGTADLPLLRRELQRDQVNRLAGLLLRPTALSRADARSLLRQEALGLRQAVEARLARPGLGAEARAHLLDTLDTLRQALDATSLRAGG